MLTISSHLWGDAHSAAVSGTENVNILRAFSKPQTIPHTLSKSCHLREILNDTCQELTDQSCNWEQPEKTLQSQASLRKQWEVASQETTRAWWQNSTFHQCFPGAITATQAERAWPPLHTQQHRDSPCSISPWAEGMGPHKQSPPSPMPLSKKSLDINAVSVWCKSPATGGHSLGIFSPEGSKWNAASKTPSLPTRSHHIPLTEGCPFTQGCNSFPWLPGRPEQTPSFQLELHLFRRYKINIFYFVEMCTIGLEALYAGLMEKSVIWTAFTRWAWNQRDWEPSFTYASIQRMYSSCRCHARQGAQGA